MYGTYENQQLSGVMVAALALSSMNVFEFQIHSCSPLRSIQNTAHMSSSWRLCVSQGGPVAFIYSPKMIVVKYFDPGPIIGGKSDDSLYAGYEEAIAFRNELVTAIVDADVGRPRRWRSVKIAPAVSLWFICNPIGFLRYDVFLADVKQQQIDKKEKRASRLIQHSYASQDTSDANEHDALYSVLSQAVYFGHSEV